MADTTIRECKKCGEYFDSIYQIDGGVCDDCKLPIDRLLDNAVKKNKSYKIINIYL